LSVYHRLPALSLFLLCDFSSGRCDDRRIAAKQKLSLFNKLRGTLDANYHSNKVSVIVGESIAQWRKTDSAGTLRPPSDDLDGPRCPEPVKIGGDLQLSSTSLRLRYPSLAAAVR
jgi:hypothetical protein